MGVFTLILWFHYVEGNVCFFPSKEQFEGPLFNHQKIAREDSRFRNSNYIHFHGFTVPLKMCRFLK